MIAISQNELAKRPLGNIELSFLHVSQFEPASVVGVLRLENAPAPEILRRALTTLQQEQPLLNVRIAAQDKAFYFEEVADSPPIPLHVQTWQNKTEWQAIATEALNSTIEIEVAPLMRCVYLYQEGENKASDLLFIYHHAIMDAASAVQFYHRLLSLCAGENVDAIGERHPFMAAADKLLPAKMRGMGKNGRFLRYMADQMVDEIRYRRQLGDGRVAPLHTTPSHNMILLRRLDKVSTKAIVRRSRRERVSMNSVVSTAMLLAVHKHLYHNQPIPLRPLTFANLRPYLDPPIASNYFGSYIAMLRYTIFCDENADFWETTKRFQAILSRSSKRSEKFIAMLMSVHLIKAATRFQSFRFGTTAVSYPGPLDLQPAYGNMRITDVHGFISNNRLGPEFAAFAKILFGELTWDFLYLEADMDQAMAETIADEVVHILQANSIID